MKSEFPKYGKSMVKNKHFKLIDFFNISDETENDTISKISEK